MYYFSYTSGYTDFKSELLMTVFYKIRAAHSVTGKGSIAIRGILPSLFPPLKQTSTSPSGKLTKTPLEMKELASLLHSLDAFSKYPEAFSQKQRNAPRRKWFGHLSLL